MPLITSKLFARHVAMSAFSIILFIIVYLVLLIFAAGLTVLCALGGLTIIIIKPNVITIGLGIGLASLGFFVFIFLLKFFFKKHKTNRSNLTEITESDEPKLFNLIREVSSEIGTDFPKQVFLSPEVNAAVFYDSSFWSMFIPVKKNLQIGLGLVNSVTEYELKAILAHEFGHFSQRSMKLGSYVYYSNQIIFNMLFDDESYSKMIQNWSNLSGYFRIFMVAAVFIIDEIRIVLKKMYEIINLNYMGLSREMEFHADEVATEITGFVPLKNSLLRMPIANQAYNEVLNFYELRFEANMSSNNIFNDQKYLMNFLATENNILLKNELPVVTTSEINRFNRSRLNIKDQWASHPSELERINAIEATGIVKEYLNDSAATKLFTNFELLGNKLTKKLFSKVSYQGITTDLDITEFSSQYFIEYSKNTFNKIYNDYYDNHNPARIDLNETTIAEEISITSLFAIDKVELIDEYTFLENDKNTLAAIHKKEYKIKSFDFDGKKYEVKEASLVIEKIDVILNQLQKEITRNDQHIYSYYYQLAKMRDTEKYLVDLYEKYLELDLKKDSFSRLYFDLVNATQFIAIVTPQEKILENFEELETLELELKEILKQLIEDGEVKSELTPLINQNIEKYVSMKFLYFGNQSEYKDGNDTYNEDNVQLLFGAIHNFIYLATRRYFLYKLKLLNYQAGLMN
jgi:Zn-dependent protease with chaperone function